MEAREHGEDCCFSKAIAGRSNVYSDQETDNDVASINLKDNGDDADDDDDDVDSDYDDDDDYDDG